MLTLLFGGVDLEHLLAGFAVSAITAIFLANLGVLLACLKPNLRATLPGIALALAAPAIFGTCGFCSQTFAAVSPVTILSVLFRIWLENDPTQDPTLGVVAATASVHLPISLGLLIWSIRAIGDRTARETPPATSIDRKREVIESTLDFRNPSIRRTYWVPPLGDAEDPILWKEKHFHLPWFDPERGCAMTAFVAGMIGLAFIATLVLFITLADDLAKSRAFGQTVKLATLFVLVPVVAFSPASLGLRVAPTLGRERAGQTLPHLFGAPIPRSAILLSILRGVLYRDRLLQCFLGCTLLLGTFGGGVDPVTAFAVFILVVGCSAWTIAFGIWLSVQIETPARASLIFLGVWFGLLLLPWLVAPFFGPETGYRIELTCPPYGLAKALLATGNEAGESGLAAEMTLVTGLTLLFIAGAFGWHAVRTFEREGR